MTTLVEAQNLLDSAINMEFSTAPAVPFTYGNQNTVSLSNGQDSYISIRILFTNSNITTLGDQCFRRHFGQLVFKVHVRDGIGDADRTALQQRIESAFVASYIGGVHLESMAQIATSVVAGWSVTGLRVNFWFDDQH